MDSSRRERILGTLGVLLLLLAVWLIATRTGGPAPNSAANVLGPMVNLPQPPAPTLPPAPTIPPTPEPTAIPRQHIIALGETLQQIADLYGLTVDTVAAYNGISDPNEVQAGQVLRLPSTVSVAPLPVGELADCRYRVKAGESLWGIATDYSVSVQSLRQVNGLAENDSLLIGQVLTIPPESPAC